MQNKLQYISLARIIAAIFVITIHTVETYGKVSTDLYWVEANIIIGIVECAVPIFFMITGATLLDYKERYSTKEYFKKRISNVIMPLGIWYLISLVYGYYFQDQSMTFPYWFFFELIGIYLCIPIFASIPKESRDQLVLYVVIISFIVNYLAPFIIDVFDLQIEVSIPFDVGFGFLLYVLMGYLLHKHEISSKWRGLIYGFGIFGFVMKAGGTYILSLEKGKLDGTFGHYENVPCFLITIAIYVFIKQISGRISSIKVQKCIHYLAGCTMASYVLHQYVSKFIIRPHITDIYSLVYNIGGPILNFMICVGITALLRKIPYIKRILP